MNKKLIKFFLSLFLIVIPTKNNSVSFSSFFKQRIQSFVIENVKIDDSQKTIFQQIIDELKEQNNLLKEQNEKLEKKANELISSVKDNNDFLASLKNSAIGVMSLFLLLTITTFSFSNSK